MLLRVGPLLLLGIAACGATGNGAPQAATRVDVDVAGCALREQLAAAAGGAHPDGWEAALRKGAAAASAPWLRTNGLPADLTFHLASAVVLPAQPEPESSLDSLLDRVGRGELELSLQLEARRAQEQVGRLSLRLCADRCQLLGRLNGAAGPPARDPDAVCAELRAQLVRDLVDVPITCPPQSAELQRAAQRAGPCLCPLRERPESKDEARQRLLRSRCTQRSDDRGQLVVSLHDGSCLYEYELDGPRLRDVFQLSIAEQTPAR